MEPEHPKKGSELHVGSVLERKRRRDDLLQHPEIALQKKGNVLRLQLRIGLIGVKEPPDPQEGIIVLRSVAILHHQLGNLVMIEGDVLQHRNMIETPMKGDALHLHQRNLLGIEGEGGILQNRVKLLEKRGDGHHHLRWYRKLLRVSSKKSKKSEKKEKKSSKKRVKGGLKQLKLLMMNQREMKDLVLKEDWSHLGDNHFNV